MNNIIKVPTIPLLFFILFNATYLIYIAGYLSQLFYYATIILYCAYGLIFIIWKDYNTNICDLKFFNGIKNVFIIIITFFLVSIISQIKNNDLEFYLFRGLFDLLMPTLVVFCIVNTDAENINSYIYILFIRAIMQFFIEGGSNLSWEAIFSINWADSSSSLTETPASHIFCLLTIIFLYQKKYITAILSTILCLISFKRFAVVVCLASWIIFRFIPNKKINKYVSWIISVLLCCTPFIVMYIYSPAGNALFYDLFKMDLNEFTTGRYGLVQQTLNHFNGNYNGLGTVANYFASLGGQMAKLGTFHCDILRIYLECSFVGVLVYVFAMMNIAKSNWRVFYMFMYLFVELIVSHFLGRFIEWTLFYLFAFLVNDINMQDNRIQSLKDIKEGSF